jgi:hypothetical protein
MTLAFLVAAVLIGADEKKKPLFATVDLDRGETVEVRLDHTHLGQREAARSGGKGSAKGSGVIASNDSQPHCLCRRQRRLAGK